MTRDIDKLLGAFKPRDYTVRLCEGIDKVLPSSPALIYYANLDGAVAALAPDAGPAVVHRARAICAEAAPQKVLQISDALDRADAGLSIYTGISSAVKAYRAGEGSRSEALGSDGQQAADAVLKGLGLSWIVHELFEGSFPEKSRAFLALDTGQHLAAYYAAIEVGLPFADNVASGAVGILEGLFSRHGAGQLKRLAAVTGPDEAEEAAAMAQSLLGPMEGMVQDSAAYLGGVAAVAAEFAPKAVGMADKVASVAATAADALPVWRFLGARLVAEYAVRRAVSEVGLHRPLGTEPAGVSVAPPLTSPPVGPPARSSGLLIAIALVALAGMGGVVAFVMIQGGDASEAGAAAEIVDPSEPAPPTEPAPPSDPVDGGSAGEEHRGKAAPHRPPEHRKGKSKAGHKRGN